MSNSVFKGEVDLIQRGNESEVQWKMHYTYLSKEVGASHMSPEFSFEGEPWHLVIEPNGNLSRNSAGFIGLRLFRRRFNGPLMKVAISLELKTAHNSQNSDMWMARAFEGNSHLDFDRIISTSDFRTRQSEFLASGYLTVVCKLKRFVGTAAKCSVCNGIYNHTEISPHEKKCRVKCPECFDVVLLRNWPDHECQISIIEGVEKHFNDLKGMMVSGENSDTTIKVKEEEFRLHKNILGARNPYFSAMFSYNMKENITGTIYIDDCEPDVFRSFIQFIYTGKLDCLSSENVCELYKVSDKYQENQLKEQCLQFMVNSISINSFCDFIIIALKYNEKELLENATFFFASKAKDITCTAKWRTFLEEYPEYVNEFHVRALDVHVQ